MSAPTTPDRHFFVTSPDVVARALAGSSWGDATLALRFGSAVVALTGLDAGQAQVLGKRYAALESTAAPDVRVRLVRAPSDGFRALDTRGWVNTLALEHEHDRLVMVGRHVVSSVAIPGGDTVIATPALDGSFVDAVENTLRAVAAYAALARGGVLLHSVGILTADGARLCFGHSGAGKSTLAATWLGLGRAIVSDELCAVERDGDAFVVEQLPFAGDVASKQLPGPRVPLAGLHRLAQGPDCRVEPLSTAVATASLSACAPFVNADPHRAHALLASLERLARRFPVSRLTLTLGADPAPLLSTRAS